MPLGESACAAPDELYDCEDCPRIGEAMEASEVSEDCAEFARLPVGLSVTGGGAGGVDPAYALSFG